MMYYITLVIAIVATSIGQVLYKYYRIKREKKYLVITIGTFFIVPVFSFISLKGLSLDTVYLATAGGMVLVLILSRFLLKEKHSFRSIAGTVLIVSGIIIYNI